MTDNTGTVIFNCTFNPFGEQLSCSPDNPSNHYRFTGKERDTEDNLDDFGARYFSSSMGRWLTPDWSARPTTVPYANFGDPQSLNLYLYVRNPVSWADSDGHIGGDLSDILSEIPQKVWENLRTGCGTARGCFLMAEKEQSEKPCGFWCRVGQRLKNGFTLHGFKTHEQLLPKGTVTTSATYSLAPNLYSVSVGIGPVSQSLTYVPSTNNFYYAPGPGYGTGFAATAGWATDPNGFASGPSVSGCYFFVVGGCGGASTSGDTAIQVGPGIGGFGVSSGYGIDPFQIYIDGVNKNLPRGPAYTVPMGDGLYTVDEQKLFGGP